MAKPNVLVLRSPGSNCDGELKFAFELAGAPAELVHINRLRENPKLLRQYCAAAISNYAATATARSGRRSWSI